MANHLKWTDEAIIADAQKYNSKKEWETHSSRPYKYALRRNLMEICSAHMQVKMESWTKEKIMEIAKRYKYRSDWWKYDKCSYDAASKRNILSECCAHMKFKLNPFTDNNGIIYAYFFNDNSVYIGLTINPKQRYFNHLKRGPVFEKIQKGFVFNYTILQKDIAYTNLPTAEIFFIELYKNKGFELMNRRKGGTLGSITTKMSIKDIKESALKYKHRNEWKIQENAYYQAAINRNILEEACSHMTYVHNRWTYENLLAEAKKYKSLKDWRKESYNSYRIAKHNEYKYNILTSVFGSEEKKKTPKL